MFHPQVLQPAPDPWFVRELKKIDPALRVVWGYERYLLNRWVIERHIPPQRYVEMYKTLKGQRFIKQPIFESGSEDEERLVGYRDFDLAPEWEQVMFVEDGEKFAPLDGRTLLKLRRTYAWDRFHSITRAKFEKQAELDAAKAANTQRRADAVLDELMDHKRELWRLPFSGQPEAVLAGTEI